MSNLKLGFVGLGNMGYIMATHLIEAGYEMVVYDINEDVLDKFVNSNTKAEKATSPKDIADKTETVLVSLPSPEVSKIVALEENGLINGRKINVYIDLSTSGQEASEMIASYLSEKGIKILDSPVSGGVVGAEKQTLALMVSGNKNIYEKHLNVLNVLSKKIFHVGEVVGQAQAMKLINNLLSTTALAITSEALVLGAKAGLDSERMIDVLNVSSGRNSATEDKIKQQVLNRSFDYGFSNDLAYKDLKLCMDLAKKTNTPMFLGQNIEHFWRYSITQGYGKKDFTSIINIFEDWSNVLIEQNKK